MGNAEVGMGNGECGMGNAEVGMGNAELTREKRKAQGKRGWRRVFCKKVMVQ